MDEYKEKGQYEQEFENELINYLSNAALTPAGVEQTPEDLDRIVRTQNWRYAPNLKTEEDLWNNFKEILEMHNQDVLKGIPLTENEFAQVKREINSLSTPYKAGQFLYGFNGVSMIEVDRDEGEHIFLTVFDQAQVGAGSTIYQVANQIRHDAVLPGRQNRRFDVTLLINGLPIIQIELKRDTGDINDALNQIHQYIEENQYSGIFNTIQILIAMTPNDARYMARTTEGNFNKAFAFHWQRAKDNQPVRNWKQFSDQVLSIPAAHNLATNFMILDGSKNKECLKAMRPYQVYATRNALYSLKHRNLNENINRLGYVWHTTGAGKTISSFKTAWLASSQPYVDKVVFLVDRKMLTSQTLEDYQAYDPQGSAENNSSIANTSNTQELLDLLTDKNPRHKIIVTSVQKLEKLVRQAEKSESKKIQKLRKGEKRIVFIVDEAHRSTSGESFQKIQNFFKKGAWLGYTGTPVFEPDPNKPKTADVFGKCIHSYTIKEAIQDRNVLGFHVDFKTTITEEAIFEKYLPEFYRTKNPNWTKEQIDEKIKNLKDVDFDDQTVTFYDHNPQHISLVVEDILENWNARSSDGKYSAILTTHVGGGFSSIPMAMDYYKEFKKQQAKRQEEGIEPLTVAVTYSVDTSNSNDMTSNNTNLLEAIQDYNEAFGTEFGLDTIDEYRNDIRARLRQQTSDHKKLDLLIVVDQMLTGFDAPKVNTLYVDRMLKGSGLVQAYSRTNRLDNMADKPFGNIVNYRWPKKTEEMMNEAFAMYANKDYGELEPGKLPDFPDEVFAKSFEESLENAKVVVDQIRKKTEDLNRVPSSDDKALELYDLMKKFNAAFRALKQYSQDEVDAVISGEGSPTEKIISKLGLGENDDFMKLSKSLQNEVIQRVKEIKKVTIDLKDDLHMLQFKETKIDYDYLTELLEQLLTYKYENKEDLLEEIKRKITEFTNTLDDTSVAKQIMRTVSAIIDNTFPMESAGITYPYANLDGRALIEASEKKTWNTMMSNFIDKWGLHDLITPEHLKDYVANHQISNRNDLDLTNELSDLTRKTQRQYKKFSTDPEIQQEKAIVFRNKFRKAMYELADEVVESLS